MKNKVSIHYLLLVSIISIALTCAYFKFRDNTVIAELGQKLVNCNEKLDRCISELEKETEWSIKCEKENFSLKTQIKNLETQLTKKNNQAL